MNAASKQQAYSLTVKLVFDRSQKFLDCKGRRTEAQPSQTGSAASPSKAKPNNITVYITIA